MRFPLLDERCEPVPENQGQGECLVLVSLLVGQHEDGPFQVVYFPSPRREYEAELLVHPRKRYSLAVLLIPPAGDYVRPAEIPECVEKDEDSSSGVLEVAEIVVAVEMRNLNGRAFGVEGIGHLLRVGDCDVYVVSFRHVLILTAKIKINNIKKRTK